MRAVPEGARWVPHADKLCSAQRPCPTCLPLLPARRGRWTEGRAVLQMLRGTGEVDAEYADICDAAQQASKVSAWQARAGRGSRRGVAGAWRGWQAGCAGGGRGRPCLPASPALLPPSTLFSCAPPPRFPPPSPQSWRNLFGRRNLPMTLMACSLAAFQQLTGINAGGGRGDWSWGCLAGAGGRLGGWQCTRDSGALQVHPAPRQLHPALPSCFTTSSLAPVCLPPVPQSSFTRPSCLRA